MANLEQYIVVNVARGEMLTPASTAVHVRELPALVSDEPPSRGGENRGPSPLELVLAALCACTNVSTARIAAKIRFSYSRLDTVAEGELDIRGRTGEANVPVHYRAVRLRVEIATEESEARIERLGALVARHCPVDSLVRAAVPDYTVAGARASS